MYHESSLLKWLEGLMIKNTRQIFMSQVGIRVS